MYITLKTTVPGPKSKRLLQKKQLHIPRGIMSTIPIYARSAKGAGITDVDGNTFIDFSGGIGATNVGHSNTSIIRTIQKQASKFVHTSFPIVGYEGYVAVCEKLNHITPGTFKKKTVLFNTGAEAVENAIKIARKYTSRQAVVSFEHGFHGRTLLTMSLTSKVKPYKFGFGPFAPEVYKLEYPYLYRKPDTCISEKAYVDYLLKTIEEEFFAGVVAPENIACMVMELVTGEGGFIIAPKRYVKGLAHLCKKYKILFIIDEVQTGFGRTGKIFACEHYGLAPDMIITGKSLSNGMPLSAVTGKAEIMDCVQKGGLGGTFIGNPLSCAAAKETLKYLVAHQLHHRAEHIGSVVMKRFKALQRRSPIVGDARGLGAMCALEIVKNKSTKEPDTLTTLKITEECYKRGLIILSAGILGNDIRTLMPLIITDAQLHEGLTVLENAVMRYSP